MKNNTRSELNAIWNSAIGAPEGAVCHAFLSRRAFRRVDLFPQKLGEPLDLLFHVGYKIFRSLLEKDDKTKHRDQENRDPENFTEQAHQATHFRSALPYVNNDCTASTLTFYISLTNFGIFHIIA